jgi:hypothetical protein
MRPANGKKVIDLHALSQDPAVVALARVSRDRLEVVDYVEIAAPRLERRQA